MKTKYEKLNGQIEELSYKMIEASGEELYNLQVKLNKLEDELEQCEVPNVEAISAAANQSRDRRNGASAN